MYGYGAGETGKNRFCGEGQLRRCGSTEGSQPFVPGGRGGSALLGSRGNAHWRVEGRQPHRVKGEMPCPGKVDACVNLYWVLPDAKLRRSGGFAALPSPEHLCRKEEKCLKLTRHNGRSGKHGTYNPRHKGLAALCTPAPAKLAFTAEAVFASFTGSVSVHLRP